MNYNWTKFFIQNLNFNKLSILKTLFLKKVLTFILIYFVGETISNMFDITLDIIDSVVWACAIYAVVRVNKK